MSHRGEYKMSNIVKRVLLMLLGGSIMGLSVMSAIVIAGSPSIQESFAVGLSYVIYTLGFVMLTYSHFLEGDS